MTPEEFEENARIITGDPTWSLTDDDDDCLTEGLCNCVSSRETSPLLKVTHLQTAPLV